MSELITRGALDAQGLSQRAINRQLSTGTLRRIWYGSYTRAAPGKPWEEYVRRCRAAAMRSNAVLSHQSAAALHGIPTYEVPSFTSETRRVHVTINGTGGGWTNGDIHAHPRPLPAADIVEIGGVRLTSRARTAVDLAMSGDFGQALTAIDAVRLRRRYPKPTDPAPVTVGQLREAVAVLGSRGGIRMFRRAVEHSVDRSESAGESRSRAMMIEWNLPAPALQRPFHLSGYDYFPDFFWAGMIGEFDGDGKYARDRERRANEARRASAFRSIGIAVVNWSWDDLANRERFFKILTLEMKRSGLIPRALPFPG